MATTTTTHAVLLLLCGFLFILGSGEKSNSDESSSESKSSSESESSQDSRARDISSEERSKVVKEMFSTCEDICRSRGGLSSVATVGDTLLGCNCADKKYIHRTKFEFESHKTNGSSSDDNSEEDSTAMPMPLIRMFSICNQACTKKGAKFVFAIQDTLLGCDCEDGTYIDAAKLKTGTAGRGTPETDVLDSLRNKEYANIDAACSVACQVFEKSQMKSVRWSRKGKKSYKCFCNRNDRPLRSGQVNEVLERQAFLFEFCYFFDIKYLTRNDVEPDITVIQNGKQVGVISAKTAEKASRCKLTDVTDVE